VRIPVDQLLAGVSRTLLEEVLPELGSRRARGRLYACIDVLHNLERRVEPARAPLEEEARSIEAALRAAATRLAELGERERAATFESALAGWPDAPAQVRVEQARDALSRAFEALAAAPPAVGDAVRPLLGGHLAAQAIRDVSVLQATLLEEISRG